VVQLFKKKAKKKKPSNTMADEDTTVDDAREIVLPSERTAKNLNKLFGVEEEPDDEVENENEEEVVVEEEVVEEEEEIEEEEEVEEKEDDSDDEDYEAPIKKKKADAPADEEIKDESHARRLAKENGRKAKELETKLQERELEIERERSEREKIQARLDELEVTRVKPHEHPDYVSLQDEVFADANAVARRLPGRAKVLLTAQGNLGKLMSEYIAVTEAEGDDILTADENLAKAIVGTLELSELSYEELDADEKKNLQPVIDKVIDVLERNLPKTRQLQNLYKKLTEQAKSGHLSMSVREYESTASEFQPILDTIGDLSEEIIEANPYAVESVVSRMVKDSPEAAKRLKNAKRDVLEVFVGPRALTQAEIDKLEANGTDVKAFLVERKKAHREKQRKLMPFFVQALMTRPLLRESLEELAKLRDEKEGEEDEFDALRRTVKKPAPKAKPEVKKNRKPGAAADALFGPED
jgi:hypothetical protein